MANTHGMFYHKNATTNIKEGLWWEEHCIRRQGGYDLDKSNLPASFRWLAKGTVLKFYAASGKAKVVKSAKVVAAVARQATTIKVEDNGILAVGDTLNGNKITAITTDGTTATLTVAATANSYNIGDVISDYDPQKDVLLGLAYETNDLRDNDYPQVTPTLECVEIEKNSLPLPVNDAIIEGLNKPGYGKHLFRIG